MTREEAIEHIKTVTKHAIDDGYDSAVVDALEMAIKALEQEPKPEWTPVKRRLPEKYGIYLVTLNDHNTDFCEFYPDKQAFGMNGYICDEVTAWMPLPEPYKAESEE